nr:response regulator [Thermoanaerobaculia bacterium]
MRAPFDVLLVEDEPVVREAAARILRPEGISLDRVEDVDGALARLRRVDHRVVLSDLMLPGFSGFDLLERVTGERPHLPVILITGYATIENALAAFKKAPSTSSPSRSTWRSCSASYAERSRRSSWAAGPPSRLKSRN